MKIRKFIAAAAAAAIAVTMTAVNVFAAPLTGSLTAAKDDYAEEGETGYAFYLEKSGGRMMESDYKWTSKTTITVTLETESDASDWYILFLGFDSSWGGWKNVKSEAGALTFSTTVGAVAEANGFTLKELAGIDVQVKNVQEDATATFKVDVKKPSFSVDVEKSAETEADSADEEVEGEPVPISDTASAPVASASGLEKEISCTVNDDVDAGRLAFTKEDIPAGTKEIKFDIIGEGNFGGAIGRNVGGAWQQDDTNYAGAATITIKVDEIDDGSPIECQVRWIESPITVKATFVSDAPAAETGTAAANTGNTAAASIAVVMAIAGVAAIASKKRK